MGLGLALFFGVGMLIVNMIFHTVGDYGVETDFFWSYVPQAEKFLRGTIMVEDFHGPLYPAILGIVRLIIGDFFQAGVIIATLSAAFVLCL
jgi:hypothetical protein